jgi:tetratricopeptide (TPR) repeat protein
MDWKKILSAILIMFVLNACAGVGIFNSAQNQFELGLDLFNRGQYEEAITHFNKSTELDPMFGRPYIYLGRSYMNLMRWPEAIPPLRTALRLSPEETKQEIVNIMIDALVAVAVSDLREGNFRNSIGSLKEAIKLEPQSGKLISELVNTLIANGRDLLSRGNTTEAINSFNEAIELSPGNINAYIGLAKAFFQNDDLLKALSAAGKAMKIDPSSRDAQSILNQLMK